MKMTYHYLASPYSHEDPWEMERKYLQVLEAIDSTFSHGRAYYSPIVHFHELAKTMNAPRTSPVWSFHNRNMLNSSAGLVILTLPGWQYSVGIKEERTWAEEFGLSIETLSVDGTLRDWI